MGNWVNRNFFRIVLPVVTDLPRPPRITTTIFQVTVQWYLGTCWLQNSSNLALVEFWWEKNVSAPSPCLPPSHLLELVWVTMPPCKGKCFINHHLLTTHQNELTTNAEVPLYLPQAGVGKRRPGGPIGPAIYFMYALQATNGRGENPKKKSMKLKSQCPSVEFYWSTACWFIGMLSAGHFHVTTAAWSS